jgi:hypothetical protein
MVSVDWRELSKVAGFEVEGDRVRISVGARWQVVRVETDEGGVRLWSTVARARQVDELRPDIINRIGEQNRLSELMGFRIDRRGRLIGEAWVPAAGLKADEWDFYVGTLAEACDRLEFVLTGKDRE